MRTLAVVLALTALAVDDTPTPVDHGIDLYKKHQYGEAATLLEHALTETGERTPRYREAVLTLGESYFMLSQAPKAIPWLEKATATTEAAYMLGYAYLQAGAPQKSAAAFARLFSLDPQSAAGHLLAAQMMLKKDYDTAAAAELQTALRLDPNIPEAHFLQAEAALFRGRVDEGIAELRQELAINPNLAKAWYRLGEAQSRQEKWQAAIPNLQRAVWLNPEYSGPYIVLGKCYFKQRDYANAEAILRRAIALDPNNHQANYLLGQTLTATGRPDEARVILDKLRPESGSPP